MTTSGEPERSRQLKSRPCLIGMPSVSKKPGRNGGAHTDRAIAHRRKRTSFHRGGRTRVSVIGSGEIRARRGVGDAGECFDFLESVLEEQALLLHIRIRTGRQDRRKKVVMFSERKPGSTFCRRRKLSINKHRADEQHERECNFGDEQTGAKSTGLSSGCAARGILERINRIAA